MLFLKAIVSKQLKALLGVFLFLALSGFSPKPQTVTDEYNLKAAFIYNFTRYIDWGGYAANKEFVIGIIGESAIHEPLEDIANTKTVDGKKIVIRKFNSPDEIGFCHILFISRNSTWSLKEIMEKATDKGTLLVSEKTGFAEQGTAINFIIMDNKLKFEANTKSINSAGLKASSQLLKLAILVDEG